MRAAVVTCVAVDLWTPVKIDLVQIKGHRHHLAGHVFVLKALFLVVAVVRRVAKRTIDAERCRHHVHDLAHLIGRHIVQNLDAFEFLPRRLDLGLSRRRLCFQNEHYYERNAQ